MFYFKLNLPPCRLNGDRFSLVSRKSLFDETRVNYGFQPHL